MLLANPLTPALTWRMPRLLDAPDTVGKEAALNTNKLLASQEAMRHEITVENNTEVNC